MQHIVLPTTRFFTIVLILVVGLTGVGIGHLIDSTSMSVAGAAVVLVGTSWLAFSGLGSLGHSSHKPVDKFNVG